MPRYVILRHEMPPSRERRSHWDLMLERDGVLCTWALPEPPNESESMSVDRLADHRLHYLDYEGPVSENRGNVTRWDAGSYELVEADPQRWVVRLAGARMVGRITLQEDAAADQRWSLEFEAE